MNLTAISIFSGGGIADIGFKQAGFQLVGAVEKDEAIARVYRQNLGNQIICSDAFDIDYSHWEGVDLLFASPPCQAYSQANQSHERITDGDITIAAHENRNAGLILLKAIAQIKPNWVVIECVPKFGKSQVYKAIHSFLEASSYCVICKIINCADLGVPQNRVRFLAIAQRALAAKLFFFPQYPVQDWYKAIADLLPTCVDAQLAPWQKRRLPNSLSSAYLVDGQNVNGKPFCEIGRPGSTVTASHGGKRFLTFPSDGNSIENAICKKLSIQCLGRLQTVPDFYQFPKGVSMAVRIIGNGFPTLAAQRLGEMILS